MLSCCRGYQLSSIQKGVYNRTNLNIQIEDGWLCSSLGNNKILLCELIKEDQHQATETMKQAQHAGNELRTPCQLVISIDYNVMYACQSHFDICQPNLVIIYRFDKIFVLYLVCELHFERRGNIKDD